MCKTLKTRTEKVNSGADKVEKDFVPKLSLLTLGMEPMEPFDTSEPGILSKCYHVLIFIVKFKSFYFAVQIVPVKKSK